MAFLFNMCWISFLVMVESNQFNEGGFSPNITCRSLSRLTDITCRWQPLEGCTNGCNLSFISRNEACRGYKQWTECLDPSAENECTFPNDRRRIIPACLEDFDVKLLCNCTATEHILESSSINTLRSNTILPNPPHDVRLRSVGQKAMNVSWELPDGWSRFDRHFLTYMYKYWQQWPPNHKSEVTLRQGGSVYDLYRLLNDLTYAFVETCVLVAVRFEDDPTISKWSWSPKPVCNRTRKEAPAAKPGNLTLNVVQASREVNVSWKEIPVELQGAPIQSYIVKFKMHSVNSTWENRSVMQKYCILTNLDRNHAYDILVAAVNEVGISDYASTFLPADPAAEFKPFVILGFVLPSIVILLVLISTAIVCRRKRRSAQQSIKRVKIKHYTDVVIKPGPGVDREVFDVPHKGMEKNIQVETCKDIETPVQMIEADPLLERTTTVSRTVADKESRRGNVVRDHMVNQVSADYVRLPNGK